MVLNGRLRIRAVGTVFFWGGGGALMARAPPLHCANVEKSAEIGIENLYLLNNFPQILEFKNGLFFMPFPHKMMEKNKLTYLALVLKFHPLLKRTQLDILVDLNFPN